MIAGLQTAAHVRAERHADENGGDVTGEDASRGLRELLAWTV
jgi:hypothetical protein